MIWRTILLFCLAALSGCKSTDQTSAVKDETPQNPLQTISVNHSVRAGDTLEYEIDATREIDQITCVYNGNYSVYVRNPDGSIRQNDEGRPYYKDGLYVHGFVRTPSGEDVEVSAPKFIDSVETDNWHDLRVPKGNKLVLKILHREEFAQDPEVIAANRTASFRKITIRYKDDSNHQSIDFIYNQDYDDAFSADAVLVQPGNHHTVEVPGDKKIYRIDVRWGDAKPRASDGTYIAGLAYGRLTVDGMGSEGDRNVAYIETQTWSGLDIPTKGAPHKITLEFSGDPARIHWIKVYYLP
ncbi:MAG: hypothetical protein AB7T49_18000 [Oligoflexales bacterium]